jgi:hypothetical protein
MPSDKFTHPALERSSWSALNQYLDCPEKYRRKRILGHAESLSWALVGGKAVHTGTEWYDLWVQKGSLGEPWDWAQMWPVIFDSTVIKEEEQNGTTRDSWTVYGQPTVKYPDRENETFWRDKGEQYCRNWQAWREANPGYQEWVTPDGEVGIELEFLLDFGGTPMKGFIDRVFTLGNKLMVVDVKSGRTMPESILQLEMYASAIDLRYGVRPELGGFWDARKGKLLHPEPLGQTIGTMDVIELIEGFVATAETGHFLPRPGRQCTYCTFNKTCPWAQALTFGMRPKVDTKEIA